MTDMTFEGLVDREFSVDELTHAMNIIPNMYDAVTRFGIFGNPMPLSTTYVRVEINNGVVNLLPTTERGGPASKGSNGRRTAKVFELPHIAHEDAVLAAEVQNMRAFGQFGPKMFQDRVNDKLVTMSMKHYLTHEWFRVGALRGVILDADGSTLLDLFTEFGVTQKQVPFGGASSINAYCLEVKRHIEDSLNGETMTGILALCSPEYFDMLIEDADVKAAYNAASAVRALNPSIQDVRAGFLHMGIMFMEYRGTAGALNADGTTTARKFIPAGDARFFPLGTMDSAHCYSGPADFVETANQPGQLFYAKPEPMKFGRGWEIHTQSNFLPLWKRPALLVRGHTGSSN